MGGLGPGIGGLEYVVIGLAALLVLGPERLPVMLDRLGKMVAKARTMANEFRASFDEMARQSELDELRKEVDALRRNQGMVGLGAEADAAFKDIRDDLAGPVDAPPPLPTPAVDEWPDAPPPAAEPIPEPRPKVRKATGRSKTSTTRKTAAPRGKAVDL